MNGIAFDFLTSKSLVKLFLYVYFAPCYLNEFINSKIFVGYLGLDS